MSPERVAPAPRGHFTARARHSRDAPQRRLLTRVKRGGTVTTGRRPSRTDVHLEPTLFARPRGERCVNESGMLFSRTSARARASTHGNRRRARASAGHSISEWSNGAPCARGASPASRPRGDARSRGVVSREIHGFSRTRGERQRVFPSRARPETRRCERNDARGTSALPGGGVLPPCRHDCALLEPVAAAHATGTPCRPGRSRGHADASCDIIRLSSFRNASRRVFVFFVFRLTLLSFLARRPTGESRELTRTYCETD